ncbi:GNAT family N-acetyltransferase [Streptomyces sp. CB01881]|uniref:GNAT family N-acetyltransferase n=1 Tax=Streptomyces sp. CB01881 TaxID=2078691 RepID=UPI000CDBA9E1|nr:GNAT family N-acetyltransferase [Streptomyces sp. CB01881]AUY49632.1 GNAT family N-acetyltransferase [Streptomyces sp. CB01881]TYC73026.1 N-acetyltransferase [Streptomyces sp. CB01881]
MTVYLATERLVLRRFTSADADRLVELDGDPEVMRYLTGGRATPREVVEDTVLPLYLAHYERYGDLSWWAAEERDGGAFLGWFEFRPTDPQDPTGRSEVELGYRLRRPAWGHGYATEGARALVRHGFTELGVRRVVAYTMAVNSGSRRVMEKSGLRYVRTFHEDYPERIPGSEHGEVEYALEAADWKA